MGACIKFWLVRAVPVVVSVFLLGLVWQQGGFNTARLAELWNEPAATGLMLLFLYGSFGASIARWRILLIAKRISIPFSRALRIGLISEFFSTILPGGWVSGEAVKVYYVTRGQSEIASTINATASVLADRAVGLVGLIGLAFVAMLLNINIVLASPILKPVGIMIGALCLASIASVALLLTANRTFLERISERIATAPYGPFLKQFFQALTEYRSTRSHLLAALVFSFFGHLGIVFALLLMARSIGGFEAVSASQFFLVVPLGLLVTAVPIAPGGIGTGHAAFYYFFRIFGSDAGADLFTVFLAAQFSVVVVGGVVWIHQRRW